MSKKHTGESLIKEAIVEEEVCELCMCESRKLILRPNLLYRFKIYDDCENCQEIAKYADSHTNEEMPGQAQLDDLIWKITKNWKPSTPEERESINEFFLSKFQ